MTQYAGNLYDQSNAREVAVNTQKAQPSSLFGTRNLRFYSLTIDYNLFSDDYNFTDDSYPITSIVADGTTATITFANPLLALEEQIIPGVTKFYIADSNDVISEPIYGQYTIKSFTSNSITIDWYKTFTYTYTSGNHAYVQLGRFSYPNSLYSLLVLAVQKVAEMYYLGSPFPAIGYGVIELPTEYGPNSFVFGVANDTVETGNDYGQDGQLGNEEDGYNYPTNSNYPGTTFPDLNSATDNSGSADIVQALNVLLDSFGFGVNGDNWYLNYADDLGWGFLPGLEVGSSN